jgi:hypothetical protein
VPCDNDPEWAATNATNLEAGSCFLSTYRGREEDIPHTRNNWLCYDFMDSVNPLGNLHGFYGFHLKSWLVETLVDGRRTISSSTASIGRMHLRMAGRAASFGW